MTQSTDNYQVLILGGGTGGIAMAARLRRALGPGRVALIEPSEYHYYQPLWTLVGGGVVKKETTQRPQGSLIPDGVTWIRDSVARVEKSTRKVICTSGREVSYDYLVVATGLKLDFHLIKGLDGHLGTNGICSIYQYRDSEKTAQMISEFRGGQALFVMPPVPIKCAGAPQKIMYLADEVFRKNGVRDKTQITFTVAGKVIFGVPSFAQALMRVVERKQINVRFLHKLIEVKPSEKIAIFERSTETVVDGQTQIKTDTVSLPYDLLHVVPPMSAHNYVRESDLAFTSGPQTGWLKVDMGTLQHLDDPRIFGIGDVTGVPNSKTGAAIRKQAPVVAQNLLDVIYSRAPSARYDGYSSCPLVTGVGKVILAEFGYDGKLMPSFPLDMTRERRSMWILKKSLLPPMYWQGMMRGRM